ncbi:Para-hydroxybenzoate--polyprenyltransferase, mitochondrial precursor (PHB:polyprenyltransferase) [Lunasporangiospora selenospora]|uniref:4-hydroxybenzoate polyprenyltransferase, mitochondrial n=1 Tax=Lunasporangiospora selenospora TaxID=979761 RepID=A0A9P6G4N2_9FUNG|nr:Para-hydroxybenzoate--polyprenyltransferase, mitochondrial precursor (PHB:polyprenyltransferase) [Lunasporangiospora selenospora]
MLPYAGSTFWRRSGTNVISIQQAFSSKVIGKGLDLRHPISRSFAAAHGFITETTQVRPFRQLVRHAPRSALCNNYFGASSPCRNILSYYQQKQDWRSSLLPESQAKHPFSTKSSSAATQGQEKEQQEKQPTLTSPGTWLDRVPPSIQPYLYLTRIDKPIGTWLLFWPCAWGITMASYGAHLPLSSTLYMIGLFGTGAVIMRGAGCTINDLWDRNIDKKVERTKVRPLASGAVSPAQAVTFLGLQLSAGLAVLTQLNVYSILLGASSLSLVVTYPAMKRITYWPQVVLGLAFNWGALLGSSAMLGATNWEVALPLYASGVCWTLVYDTIYAHQDKRDDVKVGVKSTALRFGEKTPEFLAAFSTGMVSMLALAGYMNDQGPLFYALSVGGAAAHLAWQLRTVDYEKPADCWSKFASNKWTGALVFSGIAGDYLLQMLA